LEKKFKNYINIKRKKNYNNNPIKKQDITVPANAKFKIAPKFLKKCLYIIRKKYGD